MKPITGCKRKIHFRVSLLVALLIVSVCCNAQVLRKRSVKLMGGRFDITIVAEEKAAAEQNIDTIIAEITRIENLISDWIPASQVSQVNQQAGIRPVKVDMELFALTQRAIHLSQITNGAFDISFAAMDKIWKFDGSMTEMPSPAAIKKSVEKVGYKNIVLDSNNTTIFLSKQGMKIGFGALGEGYAADRCRDMMIRRGVRAGIINATGDMSTWGNHPDGSYWKIGITNPFFKDELFAILPLQQSAVVTSGSYEKFVVFNGKRYAHIINPATGYPATGLSGVTVIGPSAEVANGLSTSVMVLGKKAGLRLIRQFRGYQYLLITDKAKVISSKSLRIKKYRVKPKD